MTEAVGEFRASVKPIEKTGDPCGTFGDDFSDEEDDEDGAIGGGGGVVAVVVGVILELGGFWS